MKIQSFKRAALFLLVDEGLQLLSVTSASALLVAVIVYGRITDRALAHSADNQPLESSFKTDASTSIATLRAMQGVLAAVSSVAIVKSFTFLYWILIGRPNGLEFASMLAIAPSTIQLGRVRLLVNSSSRFATRLFALGSLLATALLWVSGLVLFLQTSTVVVYDTAHTYDVTAGVGPFNASLVAGFMDYMNATSAGYNFRVLPYTYYSVVNNLITNPIYSSVAAPIDCDGSECTSYIFSGGIFMTSAWQPSGYRDHPLLKVSNLPAMQLEFDNHPTGSNFTDVDCDLFGDETARIGVRLCLSPRDSGALEAGLFVCTGGVANGVCNTDYPTPNLTTILSFHSLQADIVASRANSSIIVVSDLTEPKKSPLTALPEYREALRWLLDYSAANIPAPSSIVESFWTGQVQLENEHVSYGYLAQHFHSILAFPLWFFNANNFGNTELLNDEIISTLPPEFYTKAYVVAPHTMFKLNLPMVVLFAITQGLVVAFAWVMLIWATVVSASLPRISSYPLFDMTFKTETEINAGPDELWDADDAQIERMCKGSRVNRKVV
ncbi:hypothetical protein F5X68DRAFT_9182 [Plectosphaerella plurivora]|uniref:Uncharacterized protein n=1 Tax=Plectosphaerella plurivora TaxID=936078 RepID=A0A9P8VBA8_9PEZI|nr:hypothetical protein F5X68DRAFT_9182 [Plectosphaerella plurivora]